MFRSRQTYEPRIYGFRINKESVYYRRQDKSMISKRRNSPTQAIDAANRVDDVEEDSDESDDDERPKGNS